MKAADEMKKRYFTIFFYCSAMGVAIVLQILYPLLPIYAVGCLVGCCILHVYVLEDEREELQQIIAEEKRRIKEVVALAQSAQAGMPGMPGYVNPEQGATFQAPKETKKVNVDPEFPDRNVIIGAGLSDK